MSRDYIGACCVILAMFLFSHLALGIVGLDFGTFELLELIFGLRETLDIWWADWFYIAYIVAHAGLFLPLLAIGLVLLRKKVCDE